MKTGLTFSAPFLTFLFSAFFNLQTHASTNCRQIFIEEVSSKNEPLTEVAEQVERLFAQASTGISSRGFLGSLPRLTSESKEAAYAKGLMYWGIRIYIQPTIEAAFAHAREEHDPLMQGVYLIGEFAPNGRLVTPAPIEFRKLVNNGVFELVNGHFVRVDSKLVESRFLPNEMEWSISEPNRGYYLYQRGWFFPKIRGVIKYEFTQGSQSYKKLRKLARNLNNKGFRIVFNHDFAQSLKMVANQERRGQVSGSSRYNDSTFFQEMMQSYRAGKAFSAEVWDDQGRLVGGTVGLISGNLYSPDSVFYDTQNYKNGIDFAKISVLAIIERLHQAEIEFLDAGMVTHFTASLKGRYVLGSEFLSSIKSLPKQTQNPDFTSEFKP